MMVPLASFSSPAMPPHFGSPPNHARTGRDLRRDRVFHQLDDLNAVGDALAAASSDEDPEPIGTILATMDRFVVAFDWSGESALPGILAYIESHAEFPEDLFAPALVLSTIAPHHEQTAALLARLPQSVRDLLAQLPQFGSARHFFRRLPPAKVAESLTATREKRV